jgi:hypothetical protein
MYIETMPMYYNKANNTRWLFIKKCLKGTIQIPDANILFLGESRLNAAVDFNEIPGSYSFASGGSSPIEMYYILKKYSENYGNPDTVFLSISPRFLSEVFAFYPYAVRNNLFSFSDFKEITSDLAKEDTSLGKHPLITFALYKSNYIKYYQSDVMQNNVFGAFYENRKLINEMKQLKGGRTHPGLQNSCSNLNYETRYSGFVPAPVLDSYLNKICRFCKQKNIFLIFEFVPMNKSSFKQLNPAFIEEYKAYMKDLQESYSEFHISDSVFYYDDFYFGDESHLNSKGKKKYTFFLKTNYF